MLVGYVIKLLAISTLYWYMWSTNRKRDREQDISGTEDLVGTEEQQEKNRREGIERGMQDTTEIDNPAFRYSL